MAKFLEGKVAAVTGAGRGIGRGEAMALAEVGAKVVVNDLGGAGDGTGSDVAPAQQVVDEIKAAGGEAVANFGSVAEVEGAEAIVQTAIDNYENRGEIQIPDYKNSLVHGFSHEYINYMLGGSFRASFRPLNDAIMSGRIRGVAAIVGCTNPRIQHDSHHTAITEALLKQDVLVVETGCSAIASAKLGFLLGDAALDRVGPGLREVCETIGIPPVLHMGSCVDNTRILTVLTQMVAEGGLGDDIDQLPAVGLAPEWMSEKALSIATYCVASGAYVMMGGYNPVEGRGEKVPDSVLVSAHISDGWEEMYGARLEFLDDPQEMIRRTLNHIDAKRAALGLPEYDPTQFGHSGDARFNEMEEAIGEAPLEERRAALYGQVPTI